MLTSDQERALQAVQSGRNIFLTGSAGTGKSYVLRHLIAALKRRHGNNAVHVTASTGAAAVLIGGTTLHAFAGIGLGKEDAAALVKRVYANKLTSARWQRARALIIDEVSMIDCDLFDKMDYIARQLKTPGRPFGGLQLIVCGDFFQLPPVSGSSATGPKRFAFQSEAWKQAVQETVELKRVMRQGEEKFVRVLNELRWGKVSAASSAALLSCQHQARSAQWADGVELTKLYPYNVNVRAENEKRLQSLPGDVVTFTAEDAIKGRAGSLNRLDALGVEKTLQLKIGAQVMCLKNLDVASGLVNGARGVVVGMAANTTSGAGKLWPKVQFACGISQVMTPETWSVLEADSVIAERKQVPLSLAWAVSVHKCQGMTLDRVEASLSQAFDHGMVYVALSRVKSLDGLRLRGFTAAKATAHPAVVAFYRSLGCMPPMEEDRLSRNVSDALHAKEDAGDDKVPPRPPSSPSHQSPFCLFISRCLSGREVHHQRSFGASHLLTAWPCSPFDEIASWQADLSLRRADPRAMLPPPEDTDIGLFGRPCDGDQQQHAGSIGTRKTPEQEMDAHDMKEAELSDLLEVARNDPRVDPRYALSSRGGYEIERTARANGHGLVAHAQVESEDGAAGEGLGDGLRAHAGGIGAGRRAASGSARAGSKQTTSATDALAEKAARAARETQASLEQVYERKRQDKPGESVSTGLMGGHGTDGGRRRRRQAKANGGMAQVPVGTSDGIGQQISQWRQRFLSACTPATKGALVSLHADAPLAPQPQPRLVSQQGQSSSAGVAGCNEARGLLASREAGEEEDSYSRVHGVVGSSLAHHRAPSSHAPAANGAGQRSQPDAYASSAPSRAAATSIGGGGSAPAGSAGVHSAWSVREEALEKLDPRSKRARHARRVRPLASEPSFSYRGKSEFAAASGAWQV